MSEKRNEYPIEIVFNGGKFNTLVIDQHYKENHSESMNDELILELVKSLDGGTFRPDQESETGFQYFTIEPVFHLTKAYRVILVILIGDDFLGVINAFRVNL